MNFLKSSILFILICLLFYSTLKAQEIDLGRIAVLHFNAEGIDPITVKSAEFILRQEIEKLTHGDVLLQEYNDETSNACINLDCALEIGKNMGANSVVTCNFLPLGEKVIVQYNLYDVASGKKILLDNITSISLEDLDTVMKRIAMGIAGIKTVKETAEIGAIVEDESNPPLQRSGINFYGISLGYFLPSSGLKDKERSFTMDLKIGAEVEDFVYGVQMFGRKGFGVNIFSSYLLSRKDVCPYVGAGAGFHWIRDEEFGEYYITEAGYTYKQEDKKGDGFEILLNSGIRLFHTYSFQIAVDLSYSHTFNDFDSNAFTLTIGFVH